VLLAGVAGFATHAAGLRSTLAAEREVLELKNHLLHSVSHELRTPLSVILSSTELLETYADRLPAERRAAVLGQIREASGQMEAMIAQVLLLGRMEAKRMPVAPKEIELGGWMRGLAREITTAQQGRCPIEMTAPDSWVVTVDPALLHAVLGNVLGNAVKFSPAGRAVRFTLEIGDGDQRMRFTVQDEGPGISEAELGRLGEPFFRAESGNGVPGTGLGLAIADKAARLLGGELVLASDARGTRATFLLPPCPPS
jgi:signal transduction histidine kinase